MFEGYLKTIRHKGDEDVRFDARILLVIDRTDGQIAFEFFEGLLDFGQLDVVLSQVSGMLSCEIGAEQVAPFSTPNYAEFVSVQGEGEGLRGDGLVFCRQMEVDQPISMPGLFLSCTEFDQQLITGQLLLLELAQAFAEPFQSPPPHRALLVRPASTSRQDIKFSRLLDQFDLH